MTIFDDKFANFEKNLSKKSTNCGKERNSAPAFLSILNP
jgi:hypothetical protein